jgi:hypothetical protein
LALSSRSAANVQAENVGQFGNLAVQALEDVVFAAAFLTDIKLRQHENRKQKCHHQQQRRQHIDVARPKQVVVVVGFTGAATRHRR